MFNLKIEIPYESKERPLESALGIIRDGISKHKLPSQEGPWKDRYDMDVTSIDFSRPSYHGCYLEFDIVRMPNTLETYSVSSASCICDKFHDIHREISEKLQNEHFRKKGYEAYPIPYRPISLPPIPAYYRYY